MSEKSWLDGLTGEKFLAKIAEYETACAEQTLKALPKLGKKAPQYYEALGMALALADCAASCWWGCAGGDHRLEFLIGRATNSAYSALTLMRQGYYDQALSIARTLGEMANLLALFTGDRPKLEEWTNADERTRKREFAPVKVRLAIEALNVPLPIDEHRYGRLSTFSIHAIIPPTSATQRARPRNANLQHEQNRFGTLLASWWRCEGAVARMGYYEQTSRDNIIEHQRVSRLPRWRKWR